MIGVITNANSSRNRARRGHAEALRALVGEHGVVYATATIDAIKPAVRALLRADVGRWVADGGDGTFHQVLRATLEVLEEAEFRARGAALPVIVPSGGGSINFIAQHVGIRGDPEAVIARYCACARAAQPLEMVALDTLAITLHRGPGPDRESTQSTIGFAAVAGGIGEHFLQKYYASGAPGPEQVARVIAKTLLSLPLAMTPAGRLSPRLGRAAAYAEQMFEPTRARVTVDGRVLPHSEHTVISVGSLAIQLGPLLRFFPLSDPPGVMQVMAGSPPPVEIVRALPRIYRGVPLHGVPGYFESACARVSVEQLGSGPLNPIIDGELYPGLNRVDFQVGVRIRIPRVEVPTYSGSPLRIRKRLRRLAARSTARGGPAETAP